MRNWKNSLPLVGFLCTFEGHNRFSSMCEDCAPIQGTAKRGAGSFSNQFSLHRRAFQNVLDGTRLDYGSLRKTAKEVLDESEFTQQEIADELGVARTSIAKAVTQTGPKFQQLQMRILETITDCEVERQEHVEFVLREKDADDEQ